jgi:hypothetical protein
MLARVKSNGWSDLGRIRSTFHEWKNSWDAVLRSAVSLFAREREEVRMVELRCSIPSPEAHGR